jgi:hypothetical protein
VEGVREKKDWLGFEPGDALRHVARLKIKKIALFPSSASLQLSTENVFSPKHNNCIFIFPFFGSLFLSWTRIRIRFRTKKPTRIRI